METPKDPMELQNSDEADELRHKISTLVVQGFVGQDEGSRKAKEELESMGLDLTGIDKTKMLLSEIVTNLLTQLEKK